MEIGYIWAISWENLFMPYANNKGTDQPVHSRSLISMFVVRCLDSILPLLDLCKWWMLSFLTPDMGGYTWSSRNFKTLASLISWAGRFESHLVANPEDRFSRDVAHIDLTSFMSFSIVFQSYQDYYGWPGMVDRSEACPLGMQADLSSIRTSGTFFHWDFVMKKFLLPFSLFRWFKKSSCQLLAKECALSTDKLPRRFAQEQCG